MHFAFICPPLAGHVRPLAALAAELGARGHRSTFVHHRSAAAVFERSGATLAPIAAGAIGRHSGVGGSIREMARETDLLCRHAPDVLKAVGADAVVADQLEPAGGLVAERLGLPFATVACALPVNREPGVPPPFVGWRFDPSPRGRSRNAGGWRITDLLMRPLGKVIERWSDSWGLPPRRRLEDCFSPRLELAQAVPSIDFPREALPAHFHYLGPFRRAEPGQVDLPEGRFVYCSLGTTADAGGPRLFRAVAGACADLGLPLVLAHCGRLAPSEVEALPGRPRAYEFVPQAHVLARASAVVTNCGFNTVLDSLAAGLPMAALPLAFEQSATAARIERSGTGIAVRPRRPLLRRGLRSALASVLDEPDYRARAGLLQSEIAAAGGVARAASLLEAALG